MLVYGRNQTNIVKQIILQLKRNKILKRRLPQKQTTIGNYLYDRCKGFSQSGQNSQRDWDYTRKLKMLGNKFSTYMWDYKEFIIKCTSQNPFSRRKKTEKPLYMMTETAIHPNYHNQ